MNPKTTVVEHISECFIKPQHISKLAEQPLHLSQWDLAMLSVHYIQKGLLFNKSPNLCVANFLQKLKDSLSTTLNHFYPLASRLATRAQTEPPSYIVFIDSIKNSPGAKFIHANVNLTVSDILSPSDVPLIVQSFFDHDRAVNHDGHTMSLLTIQVTELIDGLFIGCSINHAIVDGTSYWHFFNAWCEMFKSSKISRLPVHNRRGPDGYGPIINLPFTNHNEFINRHNAPPLRERIFHFSAESLSRLKHKAISESSKGKISSLQALSALMWRCITRVRNLPRDQETSCRLAANNRSRLVPPLSNDYFGNSMQPVRGTAKAGELLDHDLEWAAWIVHKAVMDHNDKTIRNAEESWLKNPLIYQFGQFFDPNSIMMGSSPRFDMYGNDFGLGKGLAIRSGYANKFDGKVTLYPGVEGGGSMDLEICLLPDFMTAFQSDEEFLAAIQ